MTTTVTVTVAGHKVDVTEATPGNTEGTTTTLDVQGETRTFYAHQGNAIGIAERDEPSVSAMSKVETGGKISDVSQEQIDAATGRG